MLSDACLPVQSGLNGSRANSQGQFLLCSLELRQLYSREAEYGGSDVERAC